MTSADEIAAQILAGDHQLMEKINRLARAIQIGQITGAEFFTSIEMWAWSGKENQDGIAGQVQETPQ